MIFLALTSIVLPGERPALSDNVRINTFYPSPYEEYNLSTIRGTLAVGGSTTAAPETDINGDLTVENGNVTVRGNGLVRVGPCRGPFSTAGTKCEPPATVDGWDGLTIDPIERFVNIGTGIAQTPFEGLRLKVHARILASAFYCHWWDNTLGDWVYTYQEAEGPSTVGSTSASDAGKKGFFGARRANSSQTNVLNDTYAPMRVEASRVYLGVNETSILGVTERVSIGSESAYTSQATDTTGLKTYAALFYVNGDALGNNWTTYSSRLYKKDIVPLSSKDYGRILDQAATIDVVRFRYKEDPADSKLRIGVIAEESPREILMEGNDGLNLADSIGYLAAAMKELNTRHQALKDRLTKLEEKKARLVAK